jgi:NADPH:quinone reductase-like Zn-dependent oxidoreductase
MKAVVYEKYGPPEVLRIADVERPVPADDQVLVKVHATTVTRTDCGWRSATPFFVRYFIGLRRPKRPILGMEFAGEVVAVGAAVTEFAVGDAVFGVTGFGAHAEFVPVRQSGALAHKPSAHGYEEAAAVCDGACIALSCLRKADLRRGRSIVVYGASGSVGTAAVQLAKHFGADVTAVCGTKNLELVRSLGADDVVDYTQEDFARRGKTYDVVFDAYGRHSYRRSKRALGSGGTYIATDLGFMWHAPLLALTNRRVTFGIAKYRKGDVVFLKGLIEAGEYQAVIDRTYPLEEVVEAATYVETGQKTGNVVLTVDGAPR